MRLEGRSNDEKGGDMALIWVYGTLRRGEVNHAMVQNCAYLGQWWSPPRFYLIDLGEYPGIIAGQ